MRKFLFILFISSILFAQSEKEIDSALNIAKDFKSGKIEELRVMSNKLTSLFANTDSANGKRICNKILNYLSGLDNKLLYIRVYLDSQFFYPFKEKIKIFNRAYEMAIEEDNDNLTGIAEMMKGFAYKDKNVTDSAMICVLKAKNIFEKTGNDFDLANVLLVIADLHFYAGRLGKAEDLYKEIIKKRARPIKQGDWIYNVALDDLGLIRVKQQKYSEAEKYFLQSLGYLCSSDLNYGDSTKLAYIYRKLLEVNILQKKYKAAENYYLKALTVAQKFKQISELPGIYIGKGELFYTAGKYDSTLVYLNKAKKYELISPDIKSKIDLYRGFTKTYTALNDTDKAYPYMVLLRQAENTSDSLFHRARYMNMYAEYNYSNYLKEIDSYKKKQLIMIAIILFIFLSLAAITFYFLKFRKANKKLVKKNLEMAQCDKYLDINRSENQQGRIEPGDKSGNNGNAFDEDIFNDIYGKLETLMVNEKLYLYSDLSLEEIAGRLNTNRAYVSRTINIKYNMNFNNYINTLRIKEAIKFISTGDHKIYSIEGIAKKVGFNNRVTFNQAFHKYTGVSPSFFIKNAKNVS